MAQGYSSGDASCNISVVYSFTKGEECITRNTPKQE
jgi:hypothetical protein